MIDDIGSKLKLLRTANDLTLKDLSQKTDLSIGFLSQIERGVTSVAISTLDTIARALDTDLSHFFTVPKQRQSKILRSFEQEVFSITNSNYIDYHLTMDLDKMAMLPKLQVILPHNGENKIDTYAHEGEEFVYILEGILTVYLNDEKHELYPGDSMHYSSLIPHNWENLTNKTVKLLAVNTPNNFRK